MDELHCLQVSINELKIILVALGQFKHQCEDDGKNTTSIDNLIDRVELHVDEWDCEA